MTIQALPDYLERRRKDPDWRGCNLTMPLKEAASAWVDELDAAASGTAAVNGIFPENGRLRGFNSDVVGIRSCLDAPIPSGPKIVIGTGGAARAALFHLSMIERSEILIVGRRPEVGRQLLDRFGILGRALTLDEAGEIPGAALLINATPLGMTGLPPMPDALLRLVDRMERTATLFEMIYDPQETRLLAQARARGLATVDGLDMLIEQARASFHRFFGEVPDAAWDGELRLSLTS